MTVTETPVATGTIQWSAVFAGAVAAAAVALVLHGFAAAIGISASSAAPTWRDASFALVLLTGLYLLFAALVSYGFGGYVAARSRTRLGTVAGTEIGFSDAHPYADLYQYLSPIDCRLSDAEVNHQILRGRLLLERRGGLWCTGLRGTESLPD